MKNKITVREIAVAAGLSAFSAVVQLIHLGYQSPQFGMWIDIVAVTWIIAFFLFGWRMSLIVSTVGALVITLFAPDTWLGASMKWVASCPMWVFPALLLKFRRKNPAYYVNPLNLFVPLILALFVRCLLVIPLNYYYALPIWTGLTTAKAMAAIPWYIIALFNIIQGVVDVGVAWVLVFKFRLSRFAGWEEK